MTKAFIVHPQSATYHATLMCAGVNAEGAIVTTEERAKRHHKKTKCERSLCAVCPSYDWTEGKLLGIDCG